MSYYEEYFNLFTIYYFFLVFASLQPKESFAQTVEIDGIYYNLQSFEATSASVVSGTSKYTGDVTIPEAVTYSGKTYSVTSIGSNAFCG